MRNDVIYWIWLTELKDIGPVTQRSLLSLFYNPRCIYEKSIDELILCKGVGVTRAKEIYRSKD